MAGLNREPKPLDDNTGKGTNVARNSDTKPEAPAVDTNSGGVDAAGKAVDSLPPGTKMPGKTTDGTEKKGSNVGRNDHTTPTSGGAGIAH